MPPSESSLPSRRRGLAGDNDHTGSPAGSPPRRRGPRPGFDTAAVVDAALEVLDEAGAGGLSVRAVASRLGLHPNAVYTYVADRAALEQAVVERVLAEVDAELLAGPASTWRSRLLDYGDAMRAALLRHPGVAALFMTAPMNGPQALLVGERLIGALLDGGLSPTAAARGAYLLMVYVLGSVALEVAETDGRPPLPPEPDRIDARRAAFGTLDAAAWPHTAASVDVMAGWISTGQFRWGLERLLDGLATTAAEPL